MKPSDWPDAGGVQTSLEAERARGREGERATERQRDRETERQRDRETERQRDRETESERQRHNCVCHFTTVRTVVFSLVPAGVLQNG